MPNIELKSRDYYMHYITPDENNEVKANVERIALAFPVLVQAFHDKQKGYDNQSETQAT